MINTIRATLDDLDKVLPLIVEYYEEDRKDIQGTHFDVAMAVAGLLSNPDASVFYAEGEGEIAGVAATLTTLALGSVMTQEVFWKINKAFTKSKAGSLLVSAMEADSAEREADSITLFAICGANEKRVGNSYEGRGYSPLAHTYIKNLK
jgi:hypothetical protein